MSTMQIFDLIKIDSCFKVKTKQNILSQVVVFLLSAILDIELTRNSPCFVSSFPHTLPIPPFRNCLSIFSPISASPFSKSWLLFQSWKISSRPLMSCYWIVSVGWYLKPHNHKISATVTATVEERTRDLVIWTTLYLWLPLFCLWWG